jgi:hypothetical protein
MGMKITILSRINIDARKFDFAIMSAVKAAYELLYIFFIFKYYRYSGFELTPSFLSWCISWVLYIPLILIVARYVRERHIYILSNLLIVLIFVPAAAASAYGNADTIFQIYTFLYVSLIILGLYLFDLLQDVSFSNNKITFVAKYSFIIICLVTTIYTLISLIRQNAFYGLDALSLTNVYQIRAQLNMNGFLSYTFNWTTKVIIPFALCIAMKRKRWALLVISIAVELILYLYTGHKAVLFIPVAIVIILLAQNIKSVVFWLGSIFSIAALMVVGLSRYSDIIFSAGSLFFRRVLAIPTLLGTQYIDFTDTMGELYFSEGRIGNLLGLEYPYSLSIPNIIGLNYSGSTTSANTGLVGAGYLDMGILGVGIAAVILAVVFGLLWYCFKTKQKVFFLPLSAILLLGVMNTSVFTNLLTGGGILLLILGVLYRIGFSETSPFQNDAKDNGLRIKMANSRTIISAAAIIVGSFILFSYTTGFDLMKNMSIDYQTIVSSNDTKQIVEELNDAIKIEQAIISRIGQPKSQTIELTSFSRADYHNMVEEINKDYNDKVSVTDRCYYVKSMLLLKEKYPSVIDESKMSDCIASIASACEHYENIPNDKRILILDTLTDIETSRYSSAMTGEALQRICIPWFNNHKPESTVDMAQMAYIYKKLAKNVKAVEDMKSDLDRLADSYYKRCKDSADRRLMMPTWYENGQLLDLTETCKVIDGLISYEMFSMDKEVADSWLTVSSPKFKVAIDSTQRQLSGTLSLYDYNEDNSFRERGWIDGFTNDPGNKPIMEEDCITHAIHADTMIKLSAFQKMKDYYEKQRSISNYNNKYIYLYYVVVNGGLVNSGE